MRNKSNGVMDNGQVVRAVDEKINHVASTTSCFLGVAHGLHMLVKGSSFLILCWVFVIIILIWLSEDVTAAYCKKWGAKNFLIDTDYAVFEYFQH